MNHLDERVESRKSAIGFFFLTSLHRENLFERKKNYIVFDLNHQRNRKVFLIAAEKLKLLCDH